MTSRRSPSVRVGGVLPFAIATYELLRGLPCELITHGVGTVGSCANLVLLAGTRRYATPSSAFYFHATSLTQSDGSADALRSAGAATALDDHRTMQIMHERTGMTMADAAGLVVPHAVTLDAHRARELGIVTDIRPLEIPAGASFYHIVAPR